jgi:hypothetical protein
MCSVDVPTGCPLLLSGFISERSGPRRETKKPFRQSEGLKYLKELSSGTSDLSASRVHTGDGIGTFSAAAERLSRLLRAITLSLSG